MTDPTPAPDTAARAIRATGPTTPGGFPYRQQAHRYSGNNSERQSVGDPGHCEDCCSVGHVAAHPELGCADVQCYSEHSDPTARARVAEKEEGAGTAVLTDTKGNEVDTPDGGGVA